MRFLIALLCLIAVVQSTVTNVQENINTVERASPDYFKKVDSEISLNELIKKRHALEKRWGYGYGGGFGGNINNNNMGGFGGNINNNNMGYGGNINNNNMGWGKREVIQANEIDKIELNDVKRDVKRDFISSTQWHLNNLEAMKANLDEFKLTKRDFEEMDKMYLEDMKRFERDISKWNEKRERPINFELSQTELDAMKRDLDLFDEFESVKKIDKKDTVELTAQKTQKKDVKESIEKINKLDQIRRRREVTQANEIDKIELNDVKRDVKRDFISSNQWHLNNLEAMKANIYDFKLTKRDFLEMEKAYLDEMKRIEKDVSTWNEKLEVPDKRDVKRDVKRDFISSSQWHLNNLETMKANLDEFKLEKRDWLNNLELN